MKLICKEHSIWWFDDSVTCEICHQIDSVKAESLDEQQLEHMTLGDVQGAFEKLVTEAAQNMKRFKPYGDKS